jgi:hypothetical protein
MHRFHGVPDMVGPVSFDEQQQELIPGHECSPVSFTTTGHHRRGGSDRHAGRERPRGLDAVCVIRAGPGHLTGARGVCPEHWHVRGPLLRHQRCWLTGSRPGAHQLPSGQDGSAPEDGRCDESAAVDAPKMVMLSWQPSPVVNWHARLSGPVAGCPKIIRSSRRRRFRGFRRCRAR